MHLASSCALCRNSARSCKGFKSKERDPGAGVVSCSGMDWMQLSFECKPYKLFQGINLLLHIMSLSAACSKKEQAGRVTHHVNHLAHQLRQIGVKCECSRRATFDDFQHFWFQLIFLENNLLFLSLCAIQFLSSLIGSCRILFLTHRL